MKHEWRKHEKQFYLPKTRPEHVELPEMGFFVISGSGNPNSDDFAERIQALYAASYAVRMSPKRDAAPKGYFDYTVYPLEGVWDVSEQEKKSPSAKLNKDELVYTIMIRQPDFVTTQVADEMLAFTREKKKLPHLEDLRFERSTEGNCVQMLHVGPYDDEPATFEVMERWAETQGMKRLSKIHREIYLKDARKTAPEKLRTVLRFQVE